MRDSTDTGPGPRVANTVICACLWGPAWLSWVWWQHLGVQCWCPVQGCWLLVRWVVGSAVRGFSVKMDEEKFAYP